MKRLLFVTAVVAATITANASDFSHLVFRHKDGTEVYVKADGVRFSVSDGNLNVFHSEGTSAFAIASLSSMAFMSGESGVESVCVIPSGVDVFSITGCFWGHFDSEEAVRAEINVPGVYLLKSYPETVKIFIGK